MSQLQIIDIFPAFLEFWPTVRHKPLANQLDDWANIYMARWPELLKKQLDDYTALGEDWRYYAAEHIFPYLDQRLPDMITSHRQLPAICRELYPQAQEKLDLDDDLIALYYVGIGCGAGWVTTYAGKQAILFGLENVAEEGWTKNSTLRGFVAHELGHVAHFQRREQAQLATGDGPWWQLYTEGFAQWCEHLLMDELTWHMHDHQAANWLVWCQENRGWLASEFLRYVEEGESTRPFFGSWYNIQGYKQTGYFLGHEIVKKLAREMTLHEIALIDDMGPVVMALKMLQS